MLFWKALRGHGLVFRCHQCNASWERPAAAVTHERSFPPPGSPGDLNLSVVAMALSGYTDERNSLWREMCSSLRSQLRNPYLLVMFAFLTSEPGSYDGVLVRPPPPSDPGTNAHLVVPKNPGANHSTPKVRPHWWMDVYCIRSKGEFLTTTERIIM